MKKIPTIFQRDFSPESKGRLVTREPHPDCTWVFAGEGVATRKIDGTCCLIRDGALYKRREVKKGQPMPEQLVIQDIDETTGKTVGWVPVEIDNPTNQWHREAFGRLCDEYSTGGVLGIDLSGTYELVGPKIQGNPEETDHHRLIRHDDPSLVLPDFWRPRTYNAMMTFLANIDIEGIVWHHQDGRMAKIKKRDLGLARKPS